jgi:UDP-GlcNAc:undecaprenyl-phosphate/decaprenyl-phosphate GlcNAc-1-phosphate transferase
MAEFSLGPIIGPKVPLRDVLAPYWPVLVVGFLAALAATPLARWVAFRLKILDIPNDTVKTHRTPTAYLGGVAVLVGFLAATLVGGLIILARSQPGTVELRILVAISAGAVLSCVVGLIDDIKDLRPWQKLLGQALCSLFLVWGSIKPGLKPMLDLLGLPGLPEGIQDVLSYLIVLFFVLGASNSLNLLDGLDGLCTGVTAIITVGFLLLEIHLATWESYPPVDPIRMVVAIALVGAALGFLVFNRHPAKIFLGDAGSILLGFIIASMMMMFSLKNPRWWLASIVIFGLPILDTGTALIRRALNKRPLFLSDRGHIYDQMIDRGIRLQRTVAINYLLAALYAVVGLFSAIFLRGRVALIVDVLVLILSFALVGSKGYFRMAGLRGAVRKEP